MASSSSLGNGKRMETASAFVGTTTALIALKEHCFICFETLFARLHGYPEPRFLENPQDVPIFVTWKKSGNLRGCIGNLSPIPFPTALVDYAIRAALEDSRFEPVSTAEFPQLTCGVSLLINFEGGLVWDNWEIGTHGIVIRFNISGRSYKAIFLPEVAKEQGWTKRQTLEHLIKKAGYTGRVTQSILDVIDLERFVSSKIEVSYMEWKQHRQISLASFSN
jgi:uncharacterized protein (TIGR00296 family)